MANPSIEETKLFLGGLPQEATKDSLSAYFAQFGPVQEIEIMTDPVTKRSRGFGFVKYMQPDAAKATLNHGKDHQVNGKDIEVKVAYKKGEEAAVQAIIHNRKIFVGGLTKDSTEQVLKEYFSKYGQVVGVDIKREKGTDLIRGFGFVEFTSHHAVEVLLADPYHTICGKQMEIKKVEPKEKTRPPHKMKGVGMGYDANMGRVGRGRGGNYYQPYGEWNGGNYSTYGAGATPTNSYNPSAYGYGQPMYSGYEGAPPQQYGGPPAPPQVPPPHPGQYGYGQPPPPTGRGAPTGYPQQQPPPPPMAGQTAYDPNGAYAATAQTRTGYQQTGNEVGYPPAVGYNNANYNQSTATNAAGSTGYQQPQQQPPPPQQQQPSYYDQKSTASQSQQGYGRGGGAAATVPPAQAQNRAAYYGQQPPQQPPQQQWSNSAGQQQQPPPQQ